MSDISPEQCDEVLAKAEFDRLAKAKQFKIGPFSQEQPGFYGAPYIAPLWLFGQLKDGRKVKAKRFE